MRREDWVTPPTHHADCFTRHIDMGRVLRGCSFSVELHSDSHVMKTQKSESFPVYRECISNTSKFALSRDTLFEQLTQKENWIP